MDEKNMSLEDLIKRDRKNKGPGGRGGRGGRGGLNRGGRGGLARGGAGAGLGRRQGGVGNQFRPRGGFRGGRIQGGNRPVGGLRNQQQIGGGRGGNLRPFNKKPIRRPVIASRNPRIGGGDRPLRVQRRGGQGGAIRGGRDSGAGPKIIKRIGGDQAPQRALRKLKVRNIDEKTVSNEDLKRLFEKHGTLKECKFDRNQFGQFLGSATVVYEKAEDAKEAIKQYHGAQLDDRILTVEFDRPVVIPKVKGGNAISKGKTLRVGGRVGGRR